MFRRLAVLLLALLPASAFAAEDVDTAAPGAPINPSERRGWTAGVAGGLGDIHVFPEESDEQITEAKTGYACFGRAVGQRSLGLVWTEYSSETGLTHSAVGGGAQIFLNDRFFFRAGGGIFRFKTGSSDPADPSGGTTIDRWSPGAELALGVEWFQFRDMAVNTHLSYMAAFYPHDTVDIAAYNVSLRVGLQWYGL